MRTRRQRSLGLWVDKLQGWYNLGLSDASFDMHWSNLRSMPLHSSAILLGTIGGSKPENILTKRNVQNASYIASGKELYCTVIPMQELGKLAGREAVYELCFIDCALEPTEQQLKLLDISNHFDLLEGERMTKLIPFLESCGSNIAYYYYDGRGVFVLVRESIPALALIRSCLEPLLSNAAMERKVSISDLQIERILENSKEWVTISEKDVVATEDKIKFTCWRKTEKDNARACDMVLQDNDISISAWETRPTPKHIKIKDHSVACLLLVVLVLALVVGVLYGLYRVGYYLLSLI